MIRREQHFSRRCYRQEISQYRDIEQKLPWSQRCLRRKCWIFIAQFSYARMTEHLPGPSGKVAVEQRRHPEGDVYFE